MTGRCWILLWLAVAAACGTVEIPHADVEHAHPQIVEAVEAARQQVRDDPRSAEAWGGLGDRYRAHVRDPEAALCYARAAELDPSRFTWPYMAGVSLVEHDPEVAVVHLQAALVLDDAYAPGHVQLGRALVLAGRNEEAARHFERAVGLNPRDAHAEFGSGRLALAEGDYDEARERLERAVRILPDFAEAQHALSQTYLALGDRKAATLRAEIARSLPERTPLPDPRAARIVNPAGPSAFQAWALAMERRGEMEQAEGYFREAVEMAPERAKLRYQYGRLLLRKGRFEEAEKHLAESLRLKGSDPNPHFAMAQLAGRLGRADQARQHLEETLHLNPDHAGAHFALGGLLAAAGEFEAAIGHLDQAARRRPHEPDYQVRLGHVMMQAGRRLEAQNAYRIALQVDPRHAEAQAGLSRALRER